MKSPQPPAQLPERKLGATMLHLRASGVALLYVFAAALWFWLSDYFLGRYVDPARMVTWQNYKVLFFVFISGLLLWSERAWSDRRVHQAETQLNARMQERTSELERVRTQLQIILDKAPVSFAMRSVENRYMLVNRAWEEYMGVTRGQAVGKTPAELFPPEVAEEFARALDRVLHKSAGIVEEVEMRLQGRDYVFVRASFPLFDEMGEPYAAIGLSTDISERKVVEESLRQAEERFRAVFQTVRVGINLVDPSGRYVSANPAFQEMTGYSEAELVGKNWQDITYPPDLIEDERVTQQVEERPHETAEIEKRYVRADGSLVWTRLLISAIRDREGKLALYVTVVEDITARKETEAQRQREQAELERLVAERTAELQRANNELAEAQRIAHLGNWNFDTKSNQMEWSAEAYRIFGYEPDTSMGTQQIIATNVHPDDREYVSKIFREALTERQMLDYEHRVVRPNGEIRIVHERGYVVRDENGNPTRIFGTVQDITEDKKAEEEIRAINARLSAILEASPSGIIALDTQGLVQQWNAAAEQIYGIPATEVLGQPIPDVQVPGDLQYLELRQRVLSGESLVGLEVQRKRRDGQIIDVSIYSAPIHDGNGLFAGSVALVRDITDRKRTREALRASEERFSRLFYSSPFPAAYGGIIDGVLLDVNDRFAEFFGFARQELIGRNINELGWWIKREDRLNIFAALSEQGAALDYELTLRRRDGSLRDVLMSMYRLDFGGQEVTIGMFTDITERKHAEAEVRRLNFELEARVAQRTAHLEQEIAERVRAEAEVMALNATLAEQAEHLVAVNKELETFTYSVSHDLKAPLRGIDGYSRLLLEDYADRLDEEGQYFLNTIRGATTQMAQLIDDLLAYSRLERRTLAMGQINVRTVVESILLQVQPAHVYPRTTIMVSVESALVNADAEALSLVLRNLLDNALKFSANASAPRVEIVGKLVEQSYHLFVRDNGVGFDMQYQERIFDIFQRLHRAEDYPGTGIGLAIVRKALQRMHGRVWVESQLGQGATFYVEVPIR